MIIRGLYCGVTRAHCSRLWLYVPQRIGLPSAHWVLSDPKYWAHWTSEGATLYLLASR